MGAAMHGSRRHLLQLRAIGGAAIAAGLAAFGSIGAASAAPTCEGSYAATLLQPLPAPMVVGLDLRDDSPANRRLADRFLAGLREAGVTVGTPANVVLQISMGYRNRFGDGQAEAGAGPGTENYSDLQGGLQPVAPDLPEDRLSSPGQAPQTLLTLRLEAAAGPTKQIVWSANVQCRIIGSDDGLRAQDIGRALGGAIGQRVDRRPL
jgi:hypothetical protein